ncbi:ABC transporter permease subunit [Candidatus Parcubacteria bacterium]|nr:ABC transporter permease subunit [Candidatus Parcubacteria bacterium]
MKTRVRAYHTISLNRSISHLLPAFGFMLVPLLALVALSYVTGIAFPKIIEALVISSSRLFIAFIISVIIAWFLVIWLIRGRTANPALAMFDVLQSMPTFAILPLAVHFLGAHESIIIIFLILTIIWPIIFSIVSALKQAERSWEEAIIMTRLNGLSYIRYYLLPLTAPGIVTGSIIGLGEGWEALIATELLLNVERGLGPFFNQFSTNASITFFGVLVFLIIIFTINKFIWLPLLEKSHELIEE